MTHRDGSITMFRVTSPNEWESKPSFNGSSP
jgi:hypothetical protein